MEMSTEGWSNGLDKGRKEGQNRNEQFSMLDQVRVVGEKFQGREKMTGTRDQSWLTESWPKLRKGGVETKEIQGGAGD